MENLGPSACDNDNDDDDNGYTNQDVEDFDLYFPVSDWFNNIHVLHNPKGILFEPDDFDTKWKDLFSYPYVEQHDPETHEPNKFWLKLKEDYISGSVASDAINENPYNSRGRDEYIQRMSNRVVRDFSEFTKRAMRHGNLKEDPAGVRYSEEVGDVVFKLSFIPHKDRKWSFLGVSPDLVRWPTEMPIEIKSPFTRKIVDTLDMCNAVKATRKKVGSSIPICESLDPSIVGLWREVIISGEKCKYLSITNLPLQWSHLLDKCINYWHQCQLQAEVLDIGDSVDFVQYGTAPNKHYKDGDLISITHVPRDYNWLDRYGDKLRNTWDEILYYRANPNVPFVSTSHIDSKTEEQNEYDYIETTKIQGKRLRQDHHITITTSIGSPVTIPFDREDEILRLNQQFTAEAQSTNPNKKRLL